jgi:hypothetical protein
MFSYRFVNEIRFVAYYVYLNFLDKNIKSHSNVSTKFVISVILRFVINAREDLVMPIDATKISNPLVSLVQDE